ncbi:MAG: 30S ribosomal protein S5 [Candidatus Hydrothermarchaeaceae archaeon]
MKDDIDDWTPKTRLGGMIKDGKISNMADMFNSGLPIMEYEIIDFLLPDTVEEVLDINLVQRMHKSGRRVRFRATVVVGNNNGYVGLGKGTAKEVGPAIRKGIRDAKLKMIEIRRGCGSWECGCGLPHTVPFKIKGSTGSVRVKLLPAPSGVGIVAGGISKKIISLAGIKDIWSETRGQTQTTINMASATFDALKNTSTMKTNKNYEEIGGIVAGRINESEVKLE